MALNTTSTNASTTLADLAQAVRDSAPSDRELHINRFSNTMFAVLERRLAREFRVGDQQDLGHDPRSYQDLWEGAANWGTKVVLKYILRGDEVGNVLGLAYCAAKRSALDELNKAAVRRSVNVRPAPGEIETEVSSRLAVKETPLDQVEMHSLAQYVVRCIVGELRGSAVSDVGSYEVLLFGVLVNDVEQSPEEIAVGLVQSVRRANPGGLTSSQKETLVLALSVLQMPTADIAVALSLDANSVATYRKRARARLYRMPGLALPQRPTTRRAEVAN